VVESSRNRTFFCAHSFETMEGRGHSEFSSPNVEADSWGKTEPPRPDLVGLDKRGSHRRYVPPRVETWYFTISLNYKQNGNSYKEFLGGFS
jgi:hypothetical protein